MILLPPDECQKLPWWERGDCPAIPVPPGQTSNIVDPPSLTSWDTVTQALCLTVATLLVAMRLYTKFKVLRNPGWDDYTAFFAWIGLVALGILCLKEDQTGGNGRHLWDMTGNQYTEAAKLDYVVSVVYNPTIFFAKASILLLYLRVFNPRHCTFVILHIVLWANFTFYFSGTFIEAFQCIPIEKAWLPLMEGHCFNQKAGQISSAAINTFSDFVILVVPITNVWSLQLYKKGRLGLVFIFSFGIFACVSSITRLVEFAEKKPFIEVGVVDATWVYYSVNLVSVAEITCAIICGCLPAAPAFIRHVSGIKIKIIVSARDRSGSSLTTWGQTPRPPIQTPISKSGASTVSSPSPADLKQSPSYHSGKASIRSGGPSKGYHPWEELDDLEYVHGDDERSVVKKVKVLNPRPPAPIAQV